MQCQSFSTPADFFTSFVRAIVANTAFSLQCHAVLQYDEEQLEEQWNDSPLGKHRSDWIYLNLIILQEALIELLWFYRINYEAMNRICIKLARSCQAYSPEWEENQSIIRGHCEEHRQAHSKCLVQLDRVQARLATYQSHQSTSRLVPYNLDQDHIVIAAFFDQGNNLSIKQSRHSKTALHFGATFGMINLCMHALSKVGPVQKYILLKDGADCTPLHVSVARGHIEVTQLLLSAMDKLPTMIPDNLLHIALRREDDAMVKLLISRLVGLKHKSSSGESCLYIAAQLGREDYIRLLLPKVGPEIINVAESACQWTPLFIACIEGHLSVVKLLIDAGADTTRIDYLRWTAQENAAFRGHIPVAEMLSTINTTPKYSYTLPRKNSPRNSVSCYEVNPGLAHIVLNLGSLQERGLSKCLTLDLPGTLGYGLVLSISTSESPAAIERIVPILNDPVDDTLVFAIKHPAEAAILFNIRKWDAKHNDYSTLIGTGLALLNTQTTCLGTRHSTLLREQSVPILCKDTPRLLGTITFSFLIVEPYYQLKSTLPSAIYPGDTSSVQLVGHRGAYF